MLWASSDREHEAVASAQSASNAREGTRRVTRDPFLLGMRPIYQCGAAGQGTSAVANSDVSDGVVEASVRESVRTTA